MRPCVQVFGSSPDETANFRLYLNKENTTEALTMIQPQLTAYAMGPEAEPLQAPVRPPHLLSGLALVLAPARLAKTVTAIAKKTVGVTPLPSLLCAFQQPISDILELTQVSGKFCHFPVSFCNVAQGQDGGRTGLSLESAAGVARCGVHPARQDPAAGFILLRGGLPRHLHCAVAERGLPPVRRPCQLQAVARGGPTL